MVFEDFDDIPVVDELTRWFIRRLDELDIRVEDEAWSYDGNSDYDALFFRLQADARCHWERVYGVQPSPGELTKAFFGAEYERTRRDRLAQRSWVAKFSDYLRRRHRSL